MSRNCRQTTLPACRVELQQPPPPANPEDPTVTMTLTTASAAPTPDHDAAPRVDLYAPIHKALRHFMTDTLHRIGRLDVCDAGDMARTLGQLDTLLDLCTSHVHHENDFMHPAIEARQPRGASRTADDHIDHLESMAALRGEVLALQRAAGSRRPVLALGLYRHLALFVAENFQHMHFEETHNNAALWAHYTDAELLDLHDRLLASIPPAENMQIGRWMVPALSPVERALIVGSMKSTAPAPAFDAMLDVIRPHLDNAAWKKLARAIGLAVQPGLMSIT
jgi:hypothetical protein